jgi:hypothetical protein
MLLLLVLILFVKRTGRASIEIVGVATFRGVHVAFLQLTIDILSLGVVTHDISEEARFRAHRLPLPKLARVVDRALAALENASVVGDAANEATGHGRDPGAPDPEVGPVREGVQRIAHSDGGEARSEVAGWVEAATGRPA